MVYSNVCSDGIRKCCRIPQIPKNDARQEPEYKTDILACGISTERLMTTFKKRSLIDDFLKFVTKKLSISDLFLKIFVVRDRRGARLHRNSFRFQGRLHHGGMHEAIVQWRTVLVFKQQRIYDTTMGGVDRGLDTTVGGLVCH
jgi:hypothetical protein